MTHYELEIVRRAFEHVLKNGAPGIAEATRDSLARHASIRIAIQLNVKVPATGLAGSLE